MMRVLIIEDEKLNAKHLSYVIKKYGQMQVVATLSSNAALMDWLQKNEMPELIFSDIQLPDGDIFRSLEQGLISCPIIFITAYNNFYQNAFDNNGIAYLLKPISYERFKKALDKFFLISGQKEKNHWKRINYLLKDIQPKYKERILVKSGDSLRLLALKDVVCIQTHSGICTAINHKNQKFNFRCKISELAQTLDPEKFFLINRSELVNIDFIDKIEPFFNDRLAIKMCNIKQNLVTSASQTATFKKWLEK